jgi:hypothetical protein
MSKPIRVFFSPLSRRFYASRAYKEEAGGRVTITGEKFDVTNEIASLIEQNDIIFTRRPDADSERKQGEVSQGLASD